MENIVLVIITALISGLLATIITIWWQKHSMAYQEKLSVFKTLMSHRFSIHAEESVSALNSIDVVFYRNSSVRKAYSDFLNETSKPPESNPNSADMHLKLLEEMSKALGLKEIHWDEIKRVYFPNGLAQKLQEEALLRKAQLQNAIETAKKTQDSQNTTISGQALASQLLPELLKNPEKLTALLDLSERIKGMENGSEKK